MVGAGAVLFDILNNYDIDEVYICDTNVELINLYRIVKNNVDSLIEILSDFEEEHIKKDTENRKAYYIQQRNKYNSLIQSRTDENALTRAGLFVYLNKTCFNGLYRVNKKGLFNVPAGTYKNPKICDRENLKKTSELLQNVTILSGDYSEMKKYIDENTFVYFDPPYRPITDTASFTAYTENLFSDKEQIELARFVDDMHRKGAKILVSNSDPRNSNKEDDFFDNIYSAYKISRVEATRMINCNSEARGKIKELLISNF